MCNCQENIFNNSQSNVIFQGHNIITIVDSCIKNQSSIRNFDNENFCVKSLINWNSSDKKNTNPLTHCNEIPSENTSDLSLNYSTSESSETQTFVNERNVACKYDDNEENKYQHDDDDDDVDDDVDVDVDDNVNGNKWKVIPKKQNKLSKIHNDENSDITYTLAIIYPDIITYCTYIEQIIVDEGFEICQKKIVQMTSEQTSEFFIEKYGEIYFSHLIAYISSGPIITMILAKHHAIDDWKELIGPEEIANAKLYYPNSIRAKYSKDGKLGVHGSSNCTAAKREIHFFFPNFIFEPILTNKQVENYMWENINPILKNGITLCCKIKPQDPLMWLADWLIKNNSNPRYNEK